VEARRAAESPLRQILLTRAAAEKHERGLWTPALEGVDEAIAKKKVAGGRGGRGAKACRYQIGSQGSNPPVESGMGRSRCDKSHA
jgi:hypothetical protein